MPKSSKIPTKEIARESFDLKGSKLELVIAEGFCSDYSSGSSSSSSSKTSAARASPPRSSLVERTFNNGSPQCGFVNVACGSKIGVVLLENPKGKNVVSSLAQLGGIVQDLFGAQVKIKRERETIASSRCKIILCWKQPKMYMSYEVGFY